MALQEAILEAREKVLAKTLKEEEEEEEGREGGGEEEDLMQRLRANLEGNR